MKNYLDLQINNLIDQEFKRQSETLNLIASENYPNPAVLKTQANIFSSKYAEGYPKKRYYAGCQVIDELENIANLRLQKLFKAEYTNVQPHSGSQANMSAYAALLNLGDTVLAMSLNEGGHLTHGHPVNFSGKLYNFIHYGVDPETKDPVKVNKHPIKDDTAVAVKLQSKTLVKVTIILAVLLYTNPLLATE